MCFRCKVKECEGFNNSNWLINAIPISNDELSKCSRYAVKDNASNNDSCSEDAFDKTVQLECEELVYSDEDSAVRDVSKFIFKTNGRTSQILQKYFTNNIIIGMFPTTLDNSVLIDA